MSATSKCQAVPAFGRRTFLSAAAASLSAPIVHAATGARPSPNVVLIVMDTVRAASLGSYGYHRPTAPAFDGLAQDGVRFARAYSPASWTLPAHASMFTGLYPFEHGSHRYKSNGVFSLQRTFSKALSDAHFTLAEALSAAGYRTGSFAANTVYLTPRYSLLQGFDDTLSRKVPATDLAGEAIEWLAFNKSRNFFLFMNFMDAHTPYNTAPRPGVVERPVPDDPGLEKALYGHFRDGTLDSAPEALREQVIDQYDLGIANADAGTERIVDWLRTWRLYNDTTVIVVGDHGETFGEHGLVGHAKDVYEPLVHVPLVVKPAGGQAAEVVDDPISLVDIPRLISETLSGSARDKCQPLLRANSDAEPLLTENRYARSGEVGDRDIRDRVDRVRVAAYEWPYKYIHSTDGRHELYDVAADAEETNNLMDAEPSRAEAMRKRIESVRPLSADEDRADRSDEPVLTDDERENMRSLGYID